MTTISQPKFTLVARTVLFDGDASGLRDIDSFGSILQVRAAPFSDLDRMTSASRLTYVTYVIDAPRIYTGQGKGDRKIGDRLDPQELEQAQVYVIHSLDPRFDKLAASYVEDRLIDIADELGVPLANRTRPFGRNGLDFANLETLVVHAQFLLPIAGFRRFEEARQTTRDRPARLAATADLHDVRIIEPEEMSIPADAVMMRLVHRSVQAEGYKIGDRFVVLPGADYCYETKSGLSDDNRARREAIKKLNKQEIFSRSCRASPIAAGCASVSTARLRRLRPRSSRANTSTTAPGRSTPPGSRRNEVDMTVDLTLLAPDAVTPALTAKLRSLAYDLDRIAIAAAPTAAELAKAPLLVDWRIALTLSGLALAGFAAGHPLLGARAIVTSPLWVLDPELCWARTLSRFYRLGGAEGRRHSCGRRVMSAIRPKEPGANGGHAGPAIARVHDGCSTVRIMLMVLVMTTAMAVTVGSPARIMVPASGSTAHGQDDRASDSGIGAAGWNNRSLARQRVGRRRLALWAITGGQS